MTPEAQPAAEDRAGEARASARTCVGCGESVALDDAIVRVILGPEGGDGDAREIAIDAGARRAGGRGASLHPTPKCVAAAAQRGLPRAFKAKLAIASAPVDGRALGNAIVEALDRKIASLLGAAARSKNAVLGSEPVRAVLRSIFPSAAGSTGSGSASKVLVVLATNAEAAADTTEVRRAVAEGLAVAWSDKQGLASAVQAAGRSEGVGVVAIVDRNLAAAVKTAVQQADGLRGSGTTASAFLKKSAVE